MDLKLAIVEIETSKTFRGILSTLLTVGNFLNNSNVSIAFIILLVNVKKKQDFESRKALIMEDFFNVRKL